MPSPRKWTHEAIAHLVKRWAEGVSGSTIAAELRRPPFNMVISDRAPAAKAQHMQLPSRTPDHRVPRKPFDWGTNGRKVRQGPKEIGYRVGNIEPGFDDEMVEPLGTPAVRRSA